jgi:hypothetical protein
MDLRSLVGQTFHENQIYELLQFDIEENFGSYMRKYYLMYYEPLAEGYLKIIEFQEFLSHDDYYKIIRRDLGKRSWLEIYENHGHVDLTLTRPDTSGKLSVVHETHTHFQEMRGQCFADESMDPNRPKMTPEQRRQGFLELIDLLNSHEQMSKSKTKIPV